MWIRVRIPFRETLKCSLPGSNCKYNCLINLIFSRRCDVASDGQRFVVVQPVSGGMAQTITVVENWIKAFEDT
jgi:hypothetical protein